MISAAETGLADKSNWRSRRQARSTRDSERKEGGNRDDPRLSSRQDNDTLPREIDSDLCNVWPFSTLYGPLLRTSEMCDLLSLEMESKTTAFSHKV